AAEEKRQGMAGGQEERAPRRGPEGAEEVAQRMREVLGLEPEEVQVRPQPQPRPRPEAPAHPEPAPRELQPAAETEVRQLLQPGEQALTRLRTDVGTGRRIAPPLAPMPSGQGQDQPAVRVALDDVRLAQRAIVYHEIFSSPKALREDREMWDL
ncbi:unnamed protein product, partial [marine sediment metagenome]